MQKGDGGDEGNHNMVPEEGTFNFGRIDLIEGTISSLTFQCYFLLVWRCWTILFDHIGLFV